MKHTKRVEGFADSHAELVTQLGDLYYDSLAEFLQLLAEKIGRDGEKDRERGRMKLAGELLDCSEHLTMASESISRAWEICAPYMKE